MNKIRLVFFINGFKLFQIIILIVCFLNRFIDMASGGRKRLRDKPTYGTTFLCGQNPSASTSGGHRILSLRAKHREYHRIRLSSLCLLLHCVCLFHSILRRLSHLLQMLPQLRCCSRRYPSRFDGATGCSVC